MRVRITSDLHIDVNKTTDFGFVDKLDKVDLNIIAGDIAGSWRTEYDFLQDLQSDKPIICVAGNHLGYDYFKYSLLMNVHDTKEFSIKSLKGNINNVTYLHDDYIEYRDYIIFGGTMYTDFNLYGHSVDTYKRYGERGLNDFNNVKTFDSEIGEIRTITADDYIKWHSIFMKKLKRCLNKYKDRKFIIVTHFAPSAKSIDKKYLSGLNSCLNPCYSVNLDKFILENDNIKLWVHGHVHDSFDYKIGNCRIVCNPYGYYGYEQEISSKEYNGKIVRL